MSDVSDSSAEGTGKSLGAQTVRPKSSVESASEGIETSVGEGEARSGFEFERGDLCNDM